MGPYTIGTSVGAMLDRHERRREQGAPCVSVLVGFPGLAVRALRQWADERDRSLLQAGGLGLDALAGAWVTALSGRRELVRDAVSWLARTSDRSADELADWVARASPFDLERFLDEATLPGDPADVCRWILKPTTSRGQVAPERVLTSLAAMIPLSSASVYLAAADPRSTTKPGWLENAATALARLAEAAPRLSLVLAVEPAAFERYSREGPESRAKALVRSGVIAVAAQTESEILERLAGAAPMTVERLVEPVRRLAADGASERVAELYVAAACALETGPGEPARSAAEQFLFERLESLDATAGLFQINAELEIPFGPGRPMEVDLWAGRLGLAIEIDGYYHFQNRDAYRRDRRKDLALQQRGHLVMRVLAEDVVERLEDVLDLILEAVAACRDRGQPARGETS